MSEQEQQAEQAKVEQVKIEETQAEQAQTVAEEQENPAVEEGDALEEAIARVQELEEQLAETAKKEQDILLRSRAEMDNIRRRAEQDVEKAHKFALEKFAKDLLETIDNLERALATEVSTEDEGMKSVLDGVELTLKGLLATVARFGVEAVGVVGKPLILTYTKPFQCNQQKALKAIKSLPYYKKVIY